MIQMVRRGLRTVDPEEHPGIVKTDCVVLDFGTSNLIRHAGTGCRSRRQDRNRRSADEDLSCLRGGDPAGRHRMPALRRGVAARGSGCGRSRRCCAALGLHDDRDRPAEAVQLRVGRPLRHRGRADGHAGFAAQNGIFWLGGVWYAIGRAKGERPHLLGVGERTVCLAGRRLAEHARDRQRLQDPLLAAPAADRKQLQLRLPPGCRHDFGLTRAAPRR